VGHSIFAVVMAYLLGSISFAVVVSFLMGMKDPRTYGSGNPGASNVLRSGNKLAAILTLVGDALKGWLAVYLAKYFEQAYNLGPVTIGFVGLAAFLGHLFPIYHQFAGGKGVATAAGVLLALDYRLGLAALAVWLLLAFTVKISSVASMAAALVAPIVYVSLFGMDSIALSIGVMSVLLVWKHSANIARLIAGKEPKFGQKH
jgi:acyl phosphate:glycerol-3-phosphate acyltransferase